jgi:Putative Ig domain
MRRSARRLWPLALSLGLLSTLLDPVTPPVQGAYVAGAAGYINTWAVIGLFNNSTSNDWQTDYINETTVTPTIGSTSGGQTWEYLDDRLFSRNADDYVDLYSYYDIKKGTHPANKIAYVHTYIYSPTQQLGLKLKFGSNDGYKVWVNGVDKSSGGSSAGRLASKDENTFDLPLNAGWNRLLIKLGNQAWAWGFYARATDGSGNDVTNLSYSVNGSGSLAVATQKMTYSGSVDLPKGYVSWPYFGFEVTESRNVTNPENNQQASAFRLQAQGGTPAYAWSKVGGVLPAGLTLDSSGTITGVPKATGSFAFTARVTDSLSATAEKTLTLIVEEPPTKGFDEARLIGLVHGPEFNDESPEEFVPSIDIPQMKNEGYQYVVPQCLNEPTPQFKAPGFSSVTDFVTPIFDAVNSNGLKFGCYVSIFNADGGEHAGCDYPTQGPCVPKSPIDYSNGFDWRMAVVDDIFDEYGANLKLFWIDEIGRVLEDGHNSQWDGLEENREWDALLSFIKSRDPGVLVLMNNSELESHGRGDFDITEQEGESANGYWDYWPARTDHEKRVPVSSWRWPGFPNALIPNRDDWPTYIKVLASMAGEGFGLNLDRSPQAKFEGVYCTGNCDVDAMHTSLASWMTPGGGLPNRYPAFTNVNPSEVFAGDWGYSTINVARDKIYLHVLSNERGKTGHALNGTPLVVGPIQSTVASVKVLNTNASVTKSQSGSTLTLTTTGITPASVETIFEISLSSPEPAVQWLDPLEATLDRSAYDSGGSGSGDDDALRVRLNDRWPFIKFDVQGTSGKTIVAAKLVLKESNAIPAGDMNFQVQKTTSGSWTSSFNWSTKPALDATVYGKRVGRTLMEDQLLEIPLDPTFISGTGNHGLALVPISGNSNELDFLSMEDGWKPKLLIGVKSTSATFNPSYDVWARQDTNSADDHNLNVLYNTRYSYLRFSVTGITGKTIRSVKLVLKESEYASPGDTNFNVFRTTTTTWCEPATSSCPGSNVTNWSTKPAHGSTVYGGYHGGQLTNNQLVEIWLDPSILDNGDGEYGLALIPTSGTNDSDFNSSEEGVPPALIVTFD